MLKDINKRMRTQQVILIGLYGLLSVPLVNLVLIILLFPTVLILLFAIRNIIDIANNKSAQVPKVGAYLSCISGVLILCYTILFYQNMTNLLYVVLIWMLAVLTFTQLVAEFKGLSCLPLQVQTRKGSVLLVLVALILGVLAGGYGGAREMEVVSTTANVTASDHEQKKQEDEQKRVEQATQKKDEERKQHEETEKRLQQEEQQRQEEAQRLVHEEQKAEEQKRLEQEEQKRSAARSTTKTEQSEYFENCTELKKVYPQGVDKSHPAYRGKLDRDKDGHACE